MVDKGDKQNKDISNEDKRDGEEASNIKTPGIPIEMAKADQKEETQFHLHLHFPTHVQLPVQVSITSPIRLDLQVHNPNQQHQPNQVHKPNMSSADLKAVG